VRCAKCGYVWHQRASEPEAEPEPEPVFIPPEPPPPVFREAAPRPQAYMQTPSFEAAAQERVAKPRSTWPRRLFLGVGWIGLAAVIVLVAWIASVCRQQIVAKWPQSASLYSTLGVKTDASDLKIDNLKYRQDTEDGQPMLIVTGTLTNTGGQTLPVPQIRATLSDNDRRELYHWTFVPDAIALRPGQVTRFVTRLSSPPAATRHLDLSFVKAGE
jgi:hypothetical protein